MIEKQYNRLIALENEKKLRGIDDKEESKL